MAPEEISPRLGDKEGLQANVSNTESSLGQLSAGQETQICNHFSIRGYVAEVRKKNSVEISWPFELPGENGGFEGELSDVLPPMEIPTFRYSDCEGFHPSANTEDVPSLVLETIAFAREGDADDCEDRVAVNNQKRQLALATMTEVVQDLEMLSIERIDAGEGENFQVVDSEKRGTASGGLVLEITHSRRTDAEMECENPMVDSDRMETADVTMSGSARVMETKSFGMKDAGNECENHPVEKTDKIETAPLTIAYSGRDVISSQKRKCRSCESIKNDIKEVVMAKRQKRGSQSKRDHLGKHIKSAKPRTTFPLPVEASPTRPQDLTVEDQDLEAEIVAFLTKRQLENSLREGTEGLSEYTSAGLYGETRNSKLPETYSSKYMPETELMQLMMSGMCPRLPSPVVHIPDQLPISGMSGALKLGTSSSKSSSSNGQKAKGRAGGKKAVQCTYVVPKIEVCCTNKNPADYTVPGPRNRFMIGHKDLQRETTEAPKRGRPRKVIMEAPKSNKNGPAS